MDLYDYLKNDKRKIKSLVNALAFYADEDTYFAIGFFPDKPCGDFIKDFSKDSLGKISPGKKARAVLKKIVTAYNKDCAVTESETPSLKSSDDDFAQS